MKIVHIVDDPALGGINRLLEDLLPELAQWDHEKIVVPTHLRTAPALDAAVVVVHFTAAWMKLPFLLSLRWRNRKKRIVLVEHTYTAGYEAHCVRRMKRFRRMLRCAYALCDTVVAVSHAQSRWMLDCGLVSASKLTVIPPALNLANLRLIPLPKSHPGPLRLVAYGRYARQKGFETLIAAIKLMPEGSVSLTLAGYGPLESALKAQAADAPNIVVGGPIRYPTDLLAGADAVVIPSRWEAYGLVAAEARSAARPVIASSVDGLIDQIDGQSGLLVPSDDAAQLANAIQKLMTADLAAMGSAGRRSVSAEWQNLIAAWSALFADFETAKPAVTAARPKIGKGHHGFTVA